MNAASPRSTPDATPADDAGIGTLRTIETVQTVITALILAFVFRAFLVEAFIIPTGSMAPSLLGDHGDFVCPNCGYEFAFGPASAIDVGEPYESPAYLTCPNCQVTTDLPEDGLPRRAGDRILVHKWPYLLGGPFGIHRWDVIVFRDPIDPAQNYIKRVVALPGEAIEIIDGDVFITAPGEQQPRIARKPRGPQSSLWFPVYDHEFAALRRAGIDHPSAWTADSKEEPAAWSGFGSRVLTCTTRDGSPHTLRFDPAAGGDYLRNVYGYNHRLGAGPAGDVRLCAELTFDRPEGSLDWEITRDGVTFVAHFAADGDVELTMRDPSEDPDPTLIGRAHSAALASGAPTPIEFGHLDYRVYVRVAEQDLLATTDAQYAPNLERIENSVRITAPAIRMTASQTALTLRELRIDRDVYYTRTLSTQRALPGDPFQLADDEYFVLGDNSPRSYDSREWSRAGPHFDNPDRSPAYRMGTVPADQIVGRAFFVYLPSLLPIDRRGSWRIPDVGRMRFIR